MNMTWYNIKETPFPLEEVADTQSTDDDRKFLFIGNPWNWESKSNCLYKGSVHKREQEEEEEIEEEKIGNKKIIKKTIISHPEYYEFYLAIDLDTDSFGMPWEEFLEEYHIRYWAELPAELR